MPTRHHHRHRKHHSGERTSVQPHRRVSPTYDTWQPADGSHTLPAERARCCMPICCTPRRHVVASPSGSKVSRLKSSDKSLRRTPELPRRDSRVMGRLGRRDKTQSTTQPKTAEAGTAPQGTNTSCDEHPMQLLEESTAIVAPSDSNNVAASSRDGQQLWAAEDPLPSLVSTPAAVAHGQTSQGERIITHTELRRLPYSIPVGHSCLWHALILFDSGFVWQRRRRCVQLILACAGGSRVRSRRKVRP